MAELIIYLGWGGSFCFYLLNHGILLIVPVNILDSWISIFIVGAIQFARSEGLIAAPEPTHAIAATIREALHCRETGESKVILMAMCGHGHFDLTSYEKYLQGNMVDLLWLIYHTQMRRSKQHCPLFLKFHFELSQRSVKWWNQRVEDYIFYHKPEADAIKVGPFWQRLVEVVALRISRRNVTIFVTL